MQSFTMCVNTNPCLRVAGPAEGLSLRVLVWRPCLESTHCPQPNLSCLLRGLQCWQVYLVDSLTHAVMFWNMCSQTHHAQETCNKGSEHCWVLETIRPIRWRAEYPPFCTQGHVTRAMAQSCTSVRAELLRPMLAPGKVPV